MSRNYCPFIILLFLPCFLSAQFYKVTGTITNNKLEPLAFASIQIKELKSGILSKADGSFELKLDAGKYDFVISMVGYKSRLITIVVDRDITQNFILDLDESGGLSAVVVNAKLKDRAEEYVRNVIRHKEQILDAAGAWSCRIYIKAIQNDSFNLKKKNPDTAANKHNNPELDRLSMTEISLQYDRSAAGQEHEERLGVSKRGEPEFLFYLSATEGNFNIYNNYIRSRSVADVPFISPVSYSGLLAYHFKTIATTQQNGRKLFTISFRPTQLSSSGMEGQLVIEDSSWVILSASFRLPSWQLPEYDFFEVSQQYDRVKDTWMITRQSFRYYSKKGKGKRSGQTIATYKDFELNKQFPRGYFGNEISATTEAAYSRDSSFWSQTRTEPLTVKEIQLIRYKDSIYNATHSRAYLDSMDKVTNKLTWSRIALFGQTLHNHETQTTWELPALLSLYQPVQLGGARIMPMVFYDKIYKSKKTLSIDLDLSYGVRNKDINGSISITRMYNPFNRGFYRISAGREFKAIFEGDAWINQLKRSNIFLDNAIGIGHGLELTNGLFLYTDVDFALRRSVSDYKTGTLIDSLFRDFWTDNRAIPFTPYNALYGKVRLTYTPGQKYIREPHEKIILGSKWPTFYGLWRKGISGVLNSQVNFDYLEFGLEQQVQLANAGISSYRILTGDFPNRKDLRLIDYKFQRQGDPALFLNPNEQFQMMDSTFPVFKWFYQGHYIHEFNGYLINKIPLLKKLQLREVAGAGFLIAPERDLRYAEAFAGIERVFKWPFAPGAKFKLGIYVVGSVANQFQNPVQFKIGLTTWDRKLHKWF